MYGMYLHPDASHFRYCQRLSLNRRGICLSGWGLGPCPVPDGQLPSTVDHGSTGSIVRRARTAAAMACSRPYPTGYRTVPGTGTWTLVPSLPVPASQQAGEKMVTVHHRHSLMPCFSLSVLEVVQVQHTKPERTVHFLSSWTIPLHSIPFRRNL